MQQEGATLGLIKWFKNLVSPTEALAGRRVRYLIGATGDKIILPDQPDATVVLPYDYEHPVHLDACAAIGYINLFDEFGTGNLGPYRTDTETAQRYGERVIEQYGSGWDKNLRRQFEKWRRLGVAFVELDNAEAYPLQALLGAVDMAESYGLRVIAKNPHLIERGAKYVSRCYGIISEQGAGDPWSIDQIRQDAGRPLMPIWFVAYTDDENNGGAWAQRIKHVCEAYVGMGVTHSPDGEYTSSEDVLVPRAA